MSEPKVVDPAKKQGQLGETWGNLLLPAADLVLDDTVVFKGEEPPARYAITRVNLWPLDPSLRLFHYETKPR